MSLRFLAAASVVCLSFICGCHNCEKQVGRPAPAFKFCNPHRLIVETGWLYADLQDVIFGVEYYQDMEDLYSPGPYDD